MAWLEIIPANLTSSILKTHNLPIEILFPTSNEMIDPRIHYANEPGFTHAHFLLNPSMNQAS